MSNYASHISRLEDCEAILEYVHASLIEQGVEWFSYHFTSPLDSQTSKKTAIWARDYPLKLQKAYISENWRERDPVPKLTFQHGPFLTWRKAANFLQRTAAGKRYLARAADLEIDNWVSFALHGPRNRDGYAAMRFLTDPAEFAPGILQEIHSLLIAAHYQICTIMDGGASTVALSEREKEVLEWMGRGKSSGDIATILDISPETVRTYTRRIYDKLQTNDRVTATVRALKLGLLDL